MILEHILGTRGEILSKPSSTVDDPGGPVIGWESPKDMFWGAPRANHDYHALKLHFEAHFCKSLKIVIFHQKSRFWAKSMIPAVFPLKMKKNEKMLRICLKIIQKASKIFFLNSANPNWPCHIVSWWYSKCNAKFHVGVTTFFFQLIANLESSVSNRPSLK